MGHYEREAKIKEDKIDKVIAAKEKRDRANKINKMTPEQKTKWIMEGD